MPSAQHFLNQIADPLLRSKSVLLSLPETTPWPFTLKTELENTLKGRGFGSRLDFIDCPDGDIGEFFLLHYCKREKRASYRPTDTYAHFLATSRDIVLNHRYVWVQNIPENRLKEWKNFVAEYHAAARPGEACACFILEVSFPVPMIADTRKLVPLSFSASITPYDSFTFCTLICAEIEIPQHLRSYLAEVISSMCKKDIELCALCLNEWQQIFQDPVAGYRTITKTMQRSDGSPFSDSLTEEQLRRCLWEAQLKQLFSVIERRRMDFIDAHAADIRELLPIRNSLGEEITEPQDVELGALRYWALHEKLQTEKNEYSELDFFRKSRNKLAHLSTLSSEEVQDLLSFHP